MPTETQHLEQRVAALQSDLNTKDEQIDALTFSDNDRELSRRSWFDEAKRLEKECEGLRSDIRHLNSDLRIANDTVALGMKILAERDALLAKVRKFCWSGSDAEHIARTRAEVIAALSASAEPAKPECKHDWCPSALSSTPDYCTKCGEDRPAEQTAPKCKACHGEGVIHTGIDESPTTTCNRCEGLGHD